MNRLEKSLVCFILMPFVWIVLCIVGVIVFIGGLLLLGMLFLLGLLMLVMPLLVLIFPDLVKINGR